MYSADGTAQQIYVKVSSYTITDDDVNTYNATLPGAVSEGDMKHGKYHYKIINVK